MTEDLLQNKIKVLINLMWDDKFNWPTVERWLKNFEDPNGDGSLDRLHALFLLSNFSYFNSVVMRTLLRAMYRDLVRQPALVNIRNIHGNTRDWNVLNPAYEGFLTKTRFVGIGNPSESGTHLLYYFRQENELSKDLFVHSHELFSVQPSGQRLIEMLDNVVFLDDFCGSGDQATHYSNSLLRQLRTIKKSVRLSYFPLFATSSGLVNVRNNTIFDQVDTVAELDKSFASVSADSRYFRNAEPPLDVRLAMALSNKHGSLIEPRHPLGYKGCQLLLGFSHNIPDNTLPIFWSFGTSARPWFPIFPRHSKLGW